MQQLNMMEKPYIPTTQTKLEKRVKNIDFVQ